MAMAVSEVSEGAQLGLCVSQVIAVRVYDGRGQVAVVTPGHDQKIDLERRPLIGLILIRYPQRVRCGALRVAVPGDERTAGDLRGDDLFFPLIQLGRETIRSSMFLAWTNSAGLSPTASALK